MRVAIIAGEVTEITNLITSLRWSGDTKQAARKLKFTFLQDDRDPNLPVIKLYNGYTVAFGDAEGNVVFRGNIYNLERDRAKSQVKVVAYDNLFVLNKSKTTRKFKDALPEDIVKSICGEMGVKTGKIARTGIAVSFIANNKSGYQIIQGAYYEAHKKNEKIYQQIMSGDELNVIEKGEKCGVVADASENMTDSIYKESIENLINTVQIVDEQGNGGEIISDSESISKYSMFRAIYKQQQDKDAQTEAKAMLKKPEREGHITLFGDYRAISGYSLEVKDSLFTGQFWIKSDVHTFEGGVHKMRLTLEFENIMSEEKVEQEKAESTSARKRKN
jgi:hypothetical protein